MTEEEQKAAEALKASAESSQQIANNTHKIDKNFTNVEKRAFKFSDHLEKAADRMEGLKDSANSLLSIFGGFVGFKGFRALITDSLELDDSMQKLSVQMGKGEKSAKDFSKMVADNMVKTGASFDKAKESIQSLMKMKYDPSGIQEAAAASELFSRATDVSLSSVLDLQKALNKNGDVSAEASSKILAGMVRVQQEVGISREGMEAMTSTTKNIVNNMAAFGKSSDSIQRVTARTTALVGAMEKVGIEANKTAELVDRLLDPDKIEDNIFLYSQLGVSLEDAMSGNAEGILESADFKGMAQQIVDMGPIAGSAFAKQMNLSFKEVSRMAKAESEGISDLTEKATLSNEEKGLEALNDMTKNTMGLKSTVEATINRVEGGLLRSKKLFVAAIAIIVPLILNAWKKLRMSFTRDVKEDIQASVTDGTESVKTMFGNFISDIFKAPKDRNKEMIEEWKREMQANNELMMRDNTGLTDAEIKAKGEAQVKNQELQSKIDKMSGYKENPEITKLNEEIEHQKAIEAKNQEAINARKAKIEELEKQKVTASEDELKKINDHLAFLALQNEEGSEAQKAIKAAQEKRAEAEKLLAEKIAEEAKETNTKNGDENTEGLKRKINKFFTGLDESAKNLGQGLLNKAGKATGISDVVANVKGHNAFGAVTSGLKAVVKMGGGLLKALGPIGIGVGAAAMLMKVLQEPLDRVKEALSGLMEGVFSDEVMKPLTDSLMAIAQTLLPPLLKFAGGILRVLGWLLKPLIALVKHIPGVGESLGTMMETMTTGLGKSLGNAADNIKKNGLAQEKNTDAVEENTDVQKDGAVSITTKNGNAVLAKSNGTSVTSDGMKESAAETTSRENNSKNLGAAAKDVANVSKNTKNMETTLNNISSKLTNLISDISSGKLKVVVASGDTYGIEG